VQTPTILGIPSPEASASVLAYEIRTHLRLVLRETDIGRIEVIVRERCGLRRQNLERPS
jgi:hypothetical protein